MVGKSIQKILFFQNNSPRFISIEYLHVDQLYQHHLFVLIFLNASQADVCIAWFQGLKLKSKKHCETDCKVGLTDMGTYFCTLQCDRLCMSMGKKFEKEPNPYDLTDDELAICKSNPINCAKAYGYGFLAEKECLKIYPASDVNDESDACRHYMWSYFLVNEFGKEFAKKILDAHENNPKQKSTDKDMDIHNNNISLSDFTKSKKSLSTEDAVENFKNNLKDGKLKIIKPKFKFEAKK